MTMQEIRYEIGDQISDGIYIGLPDHAYHADPALGSTGMKKLLTDPADYWWSSPLNPALEPENDTPSKKFGRALHTCVLEGREAFFSLYAPTDHSGNTTIGRQEKKEIVDAGKTPIKRDEYNRIVAASAFIKTNPVLGNAFTNGVPELSVFWTIEIDGQKIRLKARLDYLKPMAIADLKSIRNPLGKPFIKACRDSIASYDYLISASHYMDGRRQMRRLLADGNIFGGDDASREFISTAAGVDTFAFVLVFYQAEGAPISHGFKLSPSNPLLETAHAAVDRAIWTYADMMKRFGPDAAWIDPQPLEELDETEMPAWWQVQQNQGN